MKTILSKQEALKQGLRRYFTGRPCKRGHIVERAVSNDNCVECSRLRSQNTSDYQKQWRLKNPDKVSQQQRAYYDLNREHIIEQNREYAIEHAQEKAEYIRRYYQENKDKLLRKQRPRTAKREAIKRHAWVEWADKDKITKFYENCPDGHHVDHIIPLQGRKVAGLHVHTNLQYLTVSENNRKRNKFVPFYELPSGQTILIENDVNVFREFIEERSLDKS